MVVIAVLSALTSVGVFAYTVTSGGTDATVFIGDQVLTGTALYGIAGLLLVASAMLIVATVMKSVRRAAMVAAGLALALSFGVGSFGPLISS